MSLSTAIYRVPDVNLGKFCKKGDKWNDRHIIYTKKYNRQGGGIITSTANNKLFQCLSSYGVSTPNPEGVGGNFSVVNITTFPETHLNSVEMLEICKDDMSFSTDTRWQVTGVGAVVRNYQEPAYNVSPPYKVSTPDDGNLLVGLSNQIIHIRVKNETRLVTDLGTTFATNTCVVKLHFFQLMKDMHQNSYVAHNPLQENINSGFSEFYANDGGSQLQNNSAQPLHVNIKENAFLNHACRHIAVRKMTLAPGQEAQCVVKVPQKQILSYKYKNRATIAIVDTVAPLAHTYNPIVMKKGEIFIVVELEGSLSIASDNNSALVTPASIVVYNNKQWDFTLMSRDGEKKIQNFATETMGTTVSRNQIGMNQDQLVN